MSTRDGADKPGAKPTLEQRTRPFHRALIWIWDHSPNILLAGASLPAWLVAVTTDLTFSIGDAAVSWPVVLTLVAIVMLIAGIAATVFRERSVHQLEREVAAAENFRDAFEQALYRALRDLMIDVELASQGRGEPRSDVRGTLYFHSRKDRGFIPICRFSDNPNLERPGRSRYPENQGVIGAGWEEGDAVVVDLPDIEADWLAELEELYDIPREIAEGFAMKSQSLVAVRIEHHEERLGVVVLESLRKRGVNRKLKTALLSSPALPSSCALTKLRQTSHELAVG